MKPIRLGDVEIHRVVEIPRSTYPTTDMLPTSSADVIARHRAGWLGAFYDADTGDLGSRIQSYVVRTPVLSEAQRTGAKTRSGTLDYLAGAGDELALAALIAESSDRAAAQKSWESYLAGPGGKGPWAAAAKARGDAPAALGRIDGRQAPRKRENHPADVSRPVAASSLSTRDAAAAANPASAVNTTVATFRFDATA